MVIDLLPLPFSILKPSPSQPNPVSAQNEMLSIPKKAGQCVFLVEYASQLPWPLLNSNHLANRNQRSDKKTVSRHQKCCGELLETWWNGELNSSMILCKLLHPFPKVIGTRVNFLNRFTSTIVVDERSQALFLFTIVAVAMTITNNQNRKRPPWERRSTVLILKDNRWVPWVRSSSYDLVKV